MLAVFHKSVANGPDALLSSQSDDTASALKDGVLAQHFSSLYPTSLILNFGSAAVFAHSDEDQSYLLLPRLFAVVDGIVCLFQGNITNMEKLKEQYGSNKPVNAAIIVIEAYRTLIDRGPFPVDQVLRDFEGKFVFVLFDCSSEVAFIASNADRSIIPFHWGKDFEGHLVVSDDVEIMKKGCGKSFALFPKGCFFTSSRGLRSFEYPMNELKAIRRVDIMGDVYGAKFVVEPEARRESSGMPRVGSDANWSIDF